MEEIWNCRGFSIHGGSTGKSCLPNKKADTAEMSNTAPQEEELRIMIGPAVALMPNRGSAAISNKKSPQPKPITLKFAPATASLVFEDEPEENAGNPLANSGFDPNQPRVPAGQPGGGNWMAESTALVSGGNAWKLEKASPAAAVPAPQKVVTPKPTKEIAAEVGRLKLLEEYYKHKAKEEDQSAALAYGDSGTGDVYQHHHAAAESDRRLAEEMKRRVHILRDGNINDYRNLIFKEYGMNNPDLNRIAAYYAEKFNDQDTLNWLKLQHPATRPILDADSMIMMALAPEAGEEFTLKGGAPEKSAFEKATEAEAADSTIGSKNEDDSSGETTIVRVASKYNYRATFFDAYPELKGKVKVHHSVEQQIVDRYPGLFSEAEINTLQNLRGIPNDINAKLHLSQIRMEWNEFYDSHPTATREEVLQKAAEIDSKYGSQFRPPIKK